MSLLEEWENRERLGERPESRSGNKRGIEERSCLRETDYIFHTFQYLSIRLKHYCQAFVVFRCLNRMGFVTPFIDALYLCLFSGLYSDYTHTHIIPIPPIRSLVLVLILRTLYSHSWSYSKPCTCARTYDFTLIHMHIIILTLGLLF